MKYLIASDIHGSLYFAKLLKQRFEEEKAERLVLLGDILYHGPRNDIPKDYDTKAVAALLNGLKENILCVRGNCDAEVDQMMLSFPVLCDFGVISDGDRLIYLTHGHKYNKDNPPPVKSGDIVLSGHTHVPVHEVLGGVLYLNPGSVSIPKGGSTNSYFTYTDGVFTLKKIETGEEICSFEF